MELTSTDTTSENSKSSFMVYRVFPSPQDSHMPKPRRGDLIGNLGHEVKKTGPQLGNPVVSQGGAIPQAGGEDIGNLHNPGADRQGLCQVGQQVLVRFWFLAYDDIQPVLR